MTQQEKRENLMFWFSMIGTAFTVIVGLITISSTVKQNQTAKA
jgi:hypothetical protein